MLFSLKLCLHIERQDYPDTPILHVGISLDLAVQPFSIKASPNPHQILTKSSPTTLRCFNRTLKDNSLHVAQKYLHAIVIPYPSPGHALRPFQNDLRSQGYTGHAQAVLYKQRPTSVCRCKLIPIKRPTITPVPSLSMLTETNDMQP